MKSWRDRQLAAIAILFSLLMGITWDSQEAIASTEAGCQQNATVTEVGDNGPGTLRRAIYLVCDGGTITFDLDWPATIILTSGELVVDKSLTITGPGPDLLTISGNQISRIFHTSSSSVSLNKLTLRDGLALGDNGGGILNSGTLTITDTILSQNRGWSGAAIANLGELLVVNTVLSENSALVDGGGIANSGGVVTLNNSKIWGNSAGTGGAVSNFDGALTINDSLLFGNTAFSSAGAILNDGGTATINNSTIDNNGSGYSVGGGIANRYGATLTLNYSTVSNNAANSNWIGGGIHNVESAVALYYSMLVNNSASAGGGISSYNGMLTIENSTLSGNVVAVRGGGLYIEGGDTTIDHATLAHNVADNANNVYLSIVNSFTVNNAIIAHSAEGANCDGSQSQITSLGYNLSDDSSCHLIEPTDLPNTDPLLGPLADNGGATLTHALLPGSPAIDSGDDAACPARDQRGVSRPQGAGCDRGAVEAVDITSRLDYAYVMNDGSTGQGRYTLFAGGSFVDEASGGGSWGAPAPDKLWLAYDAGYACDALLLGSVLPTDQVRGIRLCRDGSAARGVWQAVPGTGQ